MNRPLLIVIMLALFSGNCKRYPVLSLTDDSHKQIIALQPLDDYTAEQTDTLVKEIAAFYNKQVIVLKSLRIPDNFFNTTIQQYSADSLIRFLSALKNDTVVEIVGLTHRPVFTLKDDDNHKPYYDETIFGMGYQPGNSCIVSDLRFWTTDKSLFNHRLRNVIFHEIGHNLGLSHCIDDKCIMSKNNASTTILDNSGNDYCTKCRKILKLDD